VRPIEWFEAPHDWTFQERLTTSAICLMPATEFIL
jgi:hypothetical protein